MGYNIVIYPVSNFKVAHKAIEVFLGELRREGTQLNSLDKMFTRDKLYK